jgi:uncharacterized membrane protein HdeD (DUF308 family)
MQMLTSRMVDAMPDRRGWRLGLGIAMVVLGVMALAFAPLAGIVSAVVLGLAILTGGGLALMGVFRSDSVVEALLMIVLTAMLFFTGVGLLFDPVQALVAVTTLLGTFLLLSGVARIVIALFNRRGRWGLAVLHGVVNLLLGVLVFAKWPVSGLVAIGLCIGLELIIVGISWIVGRRETTERRDQRSAHTSRRRRRSAHSSSRH